MEFVGVWSVVSLSIGCSWMVPRTLAMTLISGFVVHLCVIRRRLVGRIWCA